MNKWRNLRDTYVRLKGEYMPSGSASRKKKKWEYFDLMSFLNDTINFNPTVTNLNKVSKIQFPLSCPNNIDDIEKATNNQDLSCSTKKKNQSKPTSVESAIIEAINKVNCPPMEGPTTDFNPICARISDLLQQMPQGPRTLLEIKLLQVAFERIIKEICKFCKNMMNKKHQRFLYMFT